MVRQLKTVADPSLSPDGSRLVYTLSWVDADSLESRSRIMMLELDRGQDRQFTQGVKDSGSRFSPDGGKLAFLRADRQNRRQVWVIPLNGGEARQLTSEPGGVVDFVWSPDSRQLAFCADVGPESENKDDCTPLIPEVRQVRRIRYQYDTLGWRGDSHFHIFIADVVDGPVRQVTDGDWDDLSPVWSPDGSRIAFVSGRRDDRDFRALTEAYVVPASGGEPCRWSEGLTSIGALTWSPDGQKLLAVGSPAPGFLVVWQGWLYVLEPGKPPIRLTDDSFRPLLGFPSISRPAELRWTDDHRIILLGDAQGESFLYQVSPAGDSTRRLLGGGWQNTDLTLDASAQNAVVLSSSWRSPSDLFYLNLATGDRKQLTFHNRDYLHAHPPAHLEKFSIQRGGWGIDCRLWLPPDFDASQKYPLVLDVHGGPNGAFYDSFVSWQQVLATSGYLVLAVNPRGSSTYGNDFMMAVLGDWGGEDYLDLMAAVDEVIGRPYVDETRLGVHGYSYGGYMTSWIVGHTNRFRAAVVGAPCIDLFSMYGTSDIGVSFGEVQWSNTLEEATAEGLEQLAAQLLQRSPISYVSKVETPVLLLHGEADVRCPIGQSEEYFVMLKRLGKEVEFVRFPGCSHLFPRLGHPKMREEYLARTLSWFKRYL
jgi:dipeptidyl aminopeptidase/acylaminoacyl peptidase